MTANQAKGYAFKTADRQDNITVNEASDIEMPDADQTGQSTVTVYGPRRGNEDAGKGGRNVTAVRDTSQAGRLMISFRNLDLKGKGKAKEVEDPRQQKVPEHRQGSFDEGFAARGTTVKGNVQGKTIQKEDGPDQQGSQQLPEEEESDEVPQVQAQMARNKKGKSSKSNKKKGKGRK